MPRSKDNKAVVSAALPLPDETMAELANHVLVYRTPAIHSAATSNGRVDAWAESIQNFEHEIALRMRQQGIRQMRLAGSPERVVTLCGDTVDVSLAESPRPRRVHARAASETDFLFIGDPNSPYGNPWDAAGFTDSDAVLLYREWIEGERHLRRQRPRIELLRRALIGKTLACSHALGEPCHGDFLLNIVNPVIDGGAS